jgi:hypothetical protein
MVLISIPTSEEMVERKVIQEVSITTMSVRLPQDAKVARNLDEDQQNMRNRIDEKEKQLQIILELITELEDRALKTKRNEKHEVLLKCSEILQDYASEMLKEITR